MSKNGAELAIEATTLGEIKDKSKIDKVTNNPEIIAKNILRCLNKKLKKDYPLSNKSFFIDSSYFHFP